MSKILLELYDSKFKHKVFLEKRTSIKNDYYIMYVNAVDNEKENFKDTFIYYLPNLVGNSDLLDTISSSNDISYELIKASKKIWKTSTILPHRKTNISGIYGELFLDFYLRVIKKFKAMITYVAKRPFESNYESYGYDEICYTIKQSNISLILCEAKFLKNLSNVKQKLNEDILSHFNKDYFNKYIGYVVEKSSYEQCSEIEKENFATFIKDLNSATQDEAFCMINYIKLKKIKTNFVLFAIYKDSRKIVSQIESHYDALYKSAKKHILNMGINNFEIEIVFIPTENDSMSIKREINSFYE